MWKKADALKLNNDVKWEKRNVGQERTMYFCIGFSKIWWEKIYKIIKNFVIPIVLNGYVQGCTIIDSQTWGGSYKGVW